MTKEINPYVLECIERSLTCMAVDYELYCQGNDHPSQIGQRRAYLKACASECLAEVLEDLKITQ